MSKILNHKQMARHWFKAAYGDDDVYDDGNREHYEDMLSEHHEGNWELKNLPVSSLQGHHEGHDASDSYIKEYANKRKKGSEFPPIIAKPHEGGYKTVDGQHRLKAAQQLGQTHIQAYVPVTKMTKSEELKKRFEELRKDAAPKSAAPLADESFWHKPHLTRKVVDLGHGVVGHSGAHPISPDKLQHHLKEGSFSILTANNPGSEEKTALENQEYNRGLESDLNDLGAIYHKGIGKWGSPEESFMVHHTASCTPQHLEDLATKYGQTALIHSSRGIHRMQYTTGPKAGEFEDGMGHDNVPAADDNFSQFGSDDAKFALKFGNLGKSDSPTYSFVLSNDYNEEYGFDYGFKVDGSLSKNEKKSDLKSVDLKEHHGKKVRIYYNIPKKTWSVQHKGKVIAHSDKLTIDHPHFKVGQKGRLNVQKNKSKEVHAFVDGYLNAHPQETSNEGRMRVSYNPYHNEGGEGYFYNSADKSPIHQGETANLHIEDKVGGDGKAAKIPHVMVKGASAEKPKERSRPTVKKSEQLRNRLESLKKTVR